MGGKIPHLSRWFDYVSELPECKAAAEELDLNAKRKAAAATEGSIDAKKGGGGEAWESVSRGDAIVTQSLTPSHHLWPLLLQILVPLTSACQAQRWARLSLDSPRSPRATFTSDMPR